MSFYLQVFTTALFFVAIAHTFSVGWIANLKGRYPEQARLWHLFSEVEVVFCFWSIVLVLGVIVLEGRDMATSYLGKLSYTEPLFVFSIMLLASSRPVMFLASLSTRFMAKILPFSPVLANYFVILWVAPILGSLITEPAAMTVGALLLRRHYFVSTVPLYLRYLTLAVLFVNVSIGGALTPYAAPPVLMVAAKWGWTMPYMLGHFGWRAILACFINAAFAVIVLRHGLQAHVQGGVAALLHKPHAHEGESDEPNEPNEFAKVPSWIAGLHIALLVGIVAGNHYPPIFLGLVCIFLGLAEAYPQYQKRLLLRESLMVALFLAGLTVLGGFQSWWIEKILASVGATGLYFGATALTAITDNAALTYLGSLVPNMSESLRYALVAGALSGGGLTVIANAPNPVGFGLLKDRFPEEVLDHGRLFMSAVIPTLVVIAIFWLL